MLIGRQAELAQLRAALDEARTGEGRLVLVSGEPGIGKTALVEALATVAKEAGVRTVWGRCWEGGGAAPFWPWTQIVRGVLLDRPELAGQLGEAAGDLVGLVPELSAGSPAGPPADGPDARLRLFDAVGSTLRAAAGRTGLVVAIDDLHAADEGSLELLRSVVRNLTTVPLLIAGTFREADLRAFAARQRLLDVAARHALSIRLRGLGEAEVVELLEQTAGGGDRRVAHLVHEATDGNPFLVQEAMRLVTGNRDGAGGALVLPTEARDLVRRRLDAVDPVTMHLLAVAALLGREFDVTTLGRLAGTTPDQALDALAEAELAAVVEEVGLGRWTFRHALLRDALTETLSPAEAVELHGEAADLIAASHPDDAGPQLARIAHHLLAAGDPRAAGACAAAGHAAVAVMAYEEAAHWYGRALAASPDRRLTYDLLVALADARVNSGDIDDALEAYDRAFAAARALGSVELLAEAAVRTARATASAKTPAIITALDDALCDLPEEDSPLRAHVMVSFARALSNSSVGLDTLQDINDQGLAMARRLGPSGPGSGLAGPSGPQSGLAGAAKGGLDERLWDTLWTWHQTSGLIWDVGEERRAVERQLVAMAEESGDAARLARAREAVVVDRIESGDLATAHTELDAAAREAERLRQPYLRWSLGVRRFQLTLLEGKLGEAEELAKEALAAGRRCDLAEAELAFESHLVTLRRFQGRWDELRALTEDIQRRRMGNGTHCAQMHPAVQAALSFGLKEEGRAAITHFIPRDFVERHSRSILVPGDLGRLCCVTSLGEVWWLSGDATWAAGMYGTLLPYAARHVFVPDGESRGGVSRYLGQLAALQHRYDEADSHFRAGHEQDARFGARIWQAFGWWDHARMLVARDGPGDVDEAADLLRAAWDRFRALGMDAYAVEAERRLASVPRRSLRAAIVQDGDHWSLEFDGRMVRLRDSKGVQYLVRLLRSPGQAFAAGELAGDAADPERARQSVTRAVKTTIDRLEEPHPKLAEHLRATVRTGVESIYLRDPRAPVVWE